MVQQIEAKKKRAAVGEGSAMVEPTINTNITKKESLLTNYRFKEGDVNFMAVREGKSIGVRKFTRSSIQSNTARPVGFVSWMPSCC